MRVDLRVLRDFLCRLLKNKKSKNKSKSAHRIHIKLFYREFLCENIPDNVYETEKYLLKTNSYIRGDRKMPAISSYKEICPTCNNQHN